MIILSFSFNNYSLTSTSKKKYQNKSIQKENIFTLFNIHTYNQSCFISDCRYYNTINSKLHF